MKFFSGWVREFEPRALQLRVSGAVLAVGETFTCEIHGSDRSAVFNATLILQEDELAVFSIEERIRFMPLRETARYATETLAVAVQLEGEVIDGFLADVSEAGCGAVVDKPLPKNSTLDLQIMTAGGPILCRGEVRYCRAEPGQPGKFRVGFLMASLGRLEAARWSKLFETSLAG